MTTQSPTYDAFSRSVRIVDAVLSSVEERREREARLLFGAGLKEEEVKRIVGEAK